MKFEGLSVAEAAEALGITRAMVKIRTHRATVALREALTRRFHGSPERTLRVVPIASRARDMGVGERGERT